MFPVDAYSEGISGSDWNLSGPCLRSSGSTCVERQSGMNESRMDDKVFIYPRKVGVEDGGEKLEMRGLGI